ncbi:MAG: PAS domain S-box protein [Nitrosomonadales bacterium]|nr:PAS domain S-box protein [Nitrosomonadales bacterium]
MPRKTGEKKSPRQRVEEPAFLVAGIGASAGGLEAFTQLLRNIPPDTGMAYILMQHLAQDHKSMLPEILSGISRMPVTEARDGLVVKPDHVYVNPPGYDIGLRHGTLRVTQLTAAHGLHHPIDLFFASLAADLSGRAIGVVLSGTGSDGTQGLEEIKIAGGITLAQNPQSADYPGMPLSAASSGYVDYILAPEEIAHQLSEIGRHHTQVAAQESPALRRNALSEIFTILREATGNDLLYYKSGTISRQVERRMLLNKCTSTSKYIEFLRHTHGEVKALYQDILINFTRFFRDPETFEALTSRVFPRLLQNRPINTPLRIWCAGCATGEEAYSLAICLLELMAETGETFPVQIFASDANEEAVDWARRGIYPETIALNVSTDRLRRFFIRSNDKFQVSPQVRNLCVFAKHNIANDPPFSSVDLVVCRNVLIYFGHALQKRVLRLFHYALKQDGLLMLGPSETVGEQLDLFALEDKKNKIFSCKHSINRTPLPALPRQLPSSVGIGGMLERRTNAPSIEQLADQVVLEKYTPAAVIVNDHLEILHFRGHTGTFLEPPAGEASLNLLKMVHHSLALDLRLALNKVKKSHQAIRQERLRFREQDFINLDVVPLSTSSGYTGCMLVMLELLPRPDATTSAPAPTEMPLLARELNATREELKSVIEQLESTSDELRRTNEELQVSREEWHSANEELQSTNDELEVSRTDLQLTNEELVKLNRDLATKMDELRLAAKVFDSALEGILITDANGIIQSVNPAFTTTTGYSAAEAIGQNPHFLSAGRHDALFYQSMWGEIKRHSQWRGEIWNRRKNGEIFCERLNISAIRDEKGLVSHYIGIFHDVGRVESPQATST